VQDVKPRDHEVELIVFAETPFGDANPVPRALRAALIGD
jgi:hypothetical protein